MNLPRLDILLYAHDGRGLGHASRTIAIAMALRRLYPELRLLVVTGCDQCRDLIGGSPLDWLKLPSYQTQVVGGKSKGIDGRSNFSDQELAELRSKALQQVVELYRPKLVLADHSPQGKHRELLPAVSTSPATRWILGVRGITGSVKQVQSSLAASVYQDHYSGLLWYGDSKVLGRQHKDQLGELFNTTVVETGYVSRLLELKHLQKGSPPRYEHRPPPISGTISLPWFGESGYRTASSVAKALKAIPTDSDQWHVYLGESMDKQGMTDAPLFSGSNCHVKPFGQGYAESLLRSKVALIYGGYNSLVDCLAAGIPAVVLLRKMQDREQHLHLQHLTGVNDQLIPLEEEEVTSETLAKVLAALLKIEQRHRGSIKLDGASRSAHFLAKLIEPNH